ncbi:MAG: DUF1850 domain-containing protein [Firmicutes bacterium]|nr:DUF1850 domain-containing protein [Bacillota bacterium]
MRRASSRLHGKKTIIFLAAAIILATASFLFFARLRILCLVVEVAESKEIAWAAPIGQNEQFSLHYTHSVDLLPVHDSYTVKDKNLILVETRFLSWGAGLGYMGEGILTGEKGWTIIMDMHRQLAVLPLRVGTIAVHTLLYRGKKIYLLNYVPAQTLVHIRVKNLFPYQYRKYR